MMINLNQDVISSFFSIVIMWKKLNRKINDI